MLPPPGVGPMTAATILAAWSHRGCCRDDGAFAMLAGTAPIPASTAIPRGFAGSPRRPGSARRGGRWGRPPCPRC
ncbi:transposase [Pseudonocardia oroxyli]|uniref:transposase n=1 Tax=Pseudonocardia oroxyli TaxID=366584 RepID=UPI003CCBE5E4